MSFFHYSQITASLVSSGETQPVKDESYWRCMPAQTGDRGELCRKGDTTKMSTIPGATGTSAVNLREG